MNAGTLVSRLNFALGLAANGLNAATVNLTGSPDDVNRLARSVLADDLSPATHNVIQSAQGTAAVRVGLLLGSPEFQRR